MNVEDAILQACSGVGIHPPKRHAYGKWLKTDTLTGKSGKGDGRVIIDDFRVTAWNWQTGEKITVWLKDEPSPGERKEIARKIEREDRERRAKAERAAQIACSLVAAAKLAGHPYLVAKGFRDEKALVLPATDIRAIAGDYLVPEGGQSAIAIPARIGQRITSVQLIWEHGAKKFLAGGEIGGASHRIASGACTWLCEGYATGLSLRAALKGLGMQSTILCCFSASNIVAVARQVRGRAFVSADNDKPLEQFGGLGTGEHYARQTDLPYGMPPDVGADFNDMHQGSSIFAVQRVLTSVMAGRRAV